jgi:tetratricopeptide (TPR) repeat protein
LFQKGTAYLFSGPAWHGEALTCYREGIEVTGKDRALAAQFIAGLARIFADAGDCDAFPRLVQNFERLSKGRSREVRQWGIHLWQNYGTALHNAFRFGEAAAAFTRAADLARQYGLAHLEGRCLHDLSWAQLEGGCLPEAADTMARARNLFPDAEWGHKKLNVEAEYLVATGDPSGALQRIRAALVHPRLDDTTRADLCYTSAKALFALGNPAEAKEKALLSLDYAVKAVHYPVIHKVNRFLQETAGRARAE